MNKKINIKYDISKPEGDKDRVPDCTRANQILGWNQKIDINQGLEKTFQWVKNNLD